MKHMHAATWGLLAAWAVHDIEELATMAPSSHGILSRVPEGVPVPEEWREHGVPRHHIVTAIGVMAVLMAVASADGTRTRGSSTLYRGALLGFGLHGFGHLASAAALRRYTPGVATSPVVVIPFWLWARRVLRRHGLRDIEPATVTIAALGPVLALAVHAGVRACQNGPRCTRAVTAWPAGVEPGTGVVRGQASLRTTSDRVFRCFEGDIGSTRSRIRRIMRILLR